jgi:uncharacterized repeat protein (TIGR02543 family)
MMITRLIKCILWPALLFTTACGNFSSDSERVNISITVNPANAGTVLTSGGDLAGNSVEFLALPNTGWMFAGWTGSVEGFDNPLSFTLENDVNLTANFSLFRNDYAIFLTLTDESTEVNLQIGQLPGATDFFDSGIDLESPPPPPGNTLHAGFESPERQLIHDYRNAFSPQIVWKFQISGGISENLELTWSRDMESFSGSLVLTDADGSFEADMLSVSSHIITPTQAESLQIVYTFDD